MRTAARAALAATFAVLLTATPAAGASSLFSGNRFTADFSTLVASTYVVNSTAATGDASAGNGICETAAGNGICTLPAAIQESNASVGQLDTITFNLTGAAPHQITLSGGAPTVTDPAVIDATSNPDYVSAPTVLLKGPGPTGTQSGVPVTAGGTTIRGLAIDNFGTGINLSGGDGNVVEANYVGLTTAGTVVSGSANHNGVMIQNASAQNVIGGTTAAQRNVISGNGTVPTVDGRGIIISGAGSVDNVVQGNYIGVNPAGTAAAGNRSEGVLVNVAGNNLIGGSTGTTPGGACTGACNVIGGNTGNSSNGPGIVLSGSGTTVKGNYIGLNAAGTGLIPNDFAGIVVSGANNTIGGTTPEERNVISGHGYNINIDNVSVTPTGNVVQGNYLGTNSAGTAGLNGGGGTANIQVSGANTIGGTTGTTPGGACTGACNVIDGIAGYGIINARAGNVTIQGNFVGLNPAGTGTIGNGNIGIRANFSGNVIGGTTPQARNVVAGNTGAGISLEATGNTVQGNYLGYSSDGMTLLPGTWAVDVGASNTVGGTTGVTPGGACTGQCNLIGSMVVRANSTNVIGNFVGGLRPDGLGTATGSGSGLLQVANTASGVQVGGTTPEERNILSGGSNGIQVVDTRSQTTTGVKIQGNYIGVGTDGTTAVPNAGNGVLLSVGASGVLVGGTTAGTGNVIAQNTGDGVFLGCRGASVNSGHRITGNSIYANGDLGIDICQPGVNVNDAGDPDTLEPNEGQNYPALSSASVSADGGAIITGNLNSVANKTYTVDFYSSDTCDTSGFGEAKHQIGTTTLTTDGSGNAPFNLTFPTPPNGETVITATATSPGNSTSELSKCLSYARAKGAGPIYAPLVPAYQDCVSPNRQHGGGLPFGSCAPAARGSSYLTVGTPDSNSRSPNFTGSVRYTVIAGDPATPADDANVQMAADLTDVRRASDLADYTGELLAAVSVRVTDKNNGGAATEDATMIDRDIAFPVQCTATGDPAVGSTCSTVTTVDAVLGSTAGVKETKRSNWGMGVVRVYDGGADDTAATTGDNTLFAVQGVFLP
jgi:hypothetical protein